jgi:hypothetical protein
MVTWKIERDRLFLGLCVECGHDPRSHASLANLGGCSCGCTWSRENAHEYALFARAGCSHKRVAVLEDDGRSIACCRDCGAHVTHPANKHPEPCDQPGCACEVHYVRQ